MSKTEAPPEPEPRKTAARATARRHTTQLLNMLRGKSPSAGQGAPAVPEHGLHHQPPPRQPRATAVETAPPVVAQGVVAQGHANLVAVGDRLRDARGRVSQLLKQTQQLAHLNRIFLAFLPPHLHPHATLISLDAEAWVVHTDSSAWATRLRYALPGLREPLGAQLGIQLPRPRVRIVPPSLPEPPPRPSRRLTISDKAASDLAHAACNLADARLVAAMLRLAGHARGAPRLSQGE